MRNFWLLISVLWLWTCSSGGGSSPTEPQEPAPVSNFTATPTTLIQGQSVTFTSTSTGAITSYAWNVDADPEIEGATSTYTHTYSDVGTYSVVLTVTGPGGSNSKTVADMITVSTAAPTPTTETSQTVQEDGSTTISLTATDPNGQAVTFAITSDPTNGTATLSGTEITYTPNANFYGTDSFDYTASNGTYTSDPVTITITVQGEDDGDPTTNDVSATTDEDTVVTVNLDATEIDGDNYSFSIVSQPTNGTLGSVNGNQVEYTPNQDFNGTDTFTFEATDDKTGSRSNVATATITINAVNDAPVANDITSQVTDENRLMQLDITLDATDVEGDALTYSVVGTNNGTVTVNGSTATYIPNQDWNGEDTFTYKANDGTDDSNTATVTVTVNAVNDAPVTTDQSASTDEDTAVNITLTATDVENDNLNFTIVSDVSNGTTSLSGATVTYTPDSNWNGTDTFTFKANDGTDDSNTSTVNITVASVNDAPVANDVTASMNENKEFTRIMPVTITLDATDVEGDDLTYSIVGTPSHGTLGSINNNQVVYNPTQDYNGEDTFTYKANDGTDDSNTATVTVTVNAVNDAPVTSEINATTDEDVPIDITLIGSDVDGDNLTYSVVSNTNNATIVIDGSVANYTPPENSYGNLSFTYKANDGELDSNVSTVNINVAFVNDPPIAKDMTVNTTEDGGNTGTHIQIKLDATDSDSSTISYAIVDDVSNGTLTFVNDESVRYVPNQDYNGTDTFTFQANDGNSNSNIATVTINIKSVNDAPVTQNVSFTTDEDTPYTESYSNYVSDVEGDNLTITAVTNPTNGTATCDDDTNCTYTPNQDFNGTDSFTYKVNDGELDSNVSTVTVTVTAVNDAPVANDMTATMDENKIAGRYQPVTIFLNATDVDGDDLTYSVVGSPTNGTLGSINGNQIIYTPTQDYNGEDTFTYKANDGTVDSNTATVTITINSVNDAPVTTDQTASTKEDTAVDITLTSTDVESDTITFSIVSDVSNGTTTLSGATVTYTPSANFNGTDTFTFKANDGTDDGNTSTVTITVAAVNDAPTTSDVSASTNEDTAKAITLVGADVDTGDSLIYSIVSNPSNGSLGNVSGSGVTYTPTADWNGTDTFTYKVNDGTDDSNTSTVTITVAAVNDAPTAEDITVSTNENRMIQLSITLDGSDVDGDNLTYQIVESVSNGTLTDPSAGDQVTYTPNSNWNGTETFTYKANDGTVDSNTATVTITVAAVNDTPVSSNVSASTNEDTDVAIQLEASDADNDTLTYSIISNPSSGTVGVSGATAVYTPSANFNGTDTFTFKANDGKVDSNTATVTITVAAVNDVPTTSAVSVSTNEDTAKVITLVGADVDGDDLTYSIVNNVCCNGGGSISGINGTSITYTPHTNFNGTETFTYRVNDGTANSNISTVTITVAAVNDAPTTSDVSASTNEDTAKAITLVGADVDTGDSLTYSIVSNPSNGSLGDVSGSGVTYTPTADWNGTDTFTYKVNDGTTDSNTSTVTITVAAVNDAPVASAVSAATAKNTAKTITLSATDVEGSSLTYSIVSNPSNGSLGSISGTSVTYTPDNNWSGTDTFTYKANDGTVDSNTATVTVKVVSNSKSLDFDGDDLVNMGTDAGSILVFASAMTIQAWAKADVLQSNKYIVSKGKNTDNLHRAYGLKAPYTSSQVDNNGNSGKWLGEMHVGGTEYYISSSTDAVLNEWAHLVMTYDGSTIKLYVNGTLEGTQSASGNIGGSNSKNQRFAVGSLEINDSRYRFDGSIDEVAIWDVALSVSDINTLYNGGESSDASAVQTSDLQGYWTFEGNANDLSSNGHNGSFEQGNAPDNFEPTYVDDSPEY